MSFLNSIFGKKDKKSIVGDKTVSLPENQEQPTVATGISKPGGTGKRQLIATCRSVPFQASLVVSPDESLVCCVTPNSNVAAYESGSNKEKWKVSVPSTRNSDCIFVAPERLLAVTVIYSKDYQVIKTVYQLVDTATGRLITEREGPYIYSNRLASDPRSGLCVGGTNNELVTIQTGGDKIEFFTWKSGYKDIELIKIGPDGKIYALLSGTLHRLDEKEATPIQPGRNCIHFELPARIYCGYGYGDRSGPSALYIYDLEKGTNSSVSWGNEPVSKIEPAGPDRLLIASDGGTVFRPIYSLISLFSVKEQKKEWNLTISGLPVYYGSLQTTAPEEGWALIQANEGLKLIALEDGKTISLLPRKPQPWTWVKWLASRKLLYFAGNPIKEQPGLMDCYKI